MRSSYYIDYSGKNDFTVGRTADAKRKSNRIGGTNLYPNQPTVFLSHSDCVDVTQSVINPTLSTGGETGDTSGQAINQSEEESNLIFKSTRGKFEVAFLHTFIKFELRIGLSCDMTQLPCLKF